MSTTTRTRRTGTTAITVPGLSPQELVRLQRLARELRLTDQILTWDVESVDVVGGGNAPAWTTMDGTKIVFAAQQMPKPEKALDIAVWLGTNAHEIGHVLFSPRSWSPLMQRLAAAGEDLLYRIHNVVEDQRQERLLLGRFAAWEGYLLAALAHHLDPQAPGAWFPLAGRTWLPAADRAAARLAWGDDAVADRIGALVGDYQRLTDPGSAEAAEAWRILNELAPLVASAAPPTTCEPMEGGEPEGDDATDPDLPDAADEINVNYGPAGDNAGDDGEEADGDGGKGEGEGSDDAEAAKGAGTEEGKAQPGTTESIQEAAAAAIERDAAEDLQRVQDAVDSPSGAPDSSTAARHPGEWEEVSDTARQLEVGVSHALLDLKDECEAGWLKRTDSGRLNTRRWSCDATADYDTMFDRFDPGALDAADMEVVLLVDTSGSMDHEVRDLAEAVWAIRHAVDRMEGTLHAFAFDGGVRVLHTSDERPDGRMFVPHAGGGTDPSDALMEAYRLLANSPARNRICLTLTDGQWGGSRFRPTLTALNEAGVVTALAVLGPWQLDEFAYGQQVTQTIRHPGELAAMFKEIAARLIEANR